MYSKPRLFRQSIMKSLPLRPTVNGSSAGGTAVSAARFGSGTALRAGAGCATALSGVVSAAAPASPAPLRNRRRFTFGTSLALDIARSRSFGCRLRGLNGLSAAILFVRQKGVDAVRGRAAPGLCGPAITNWVGFAASDRLARYDNLWARMESRMTVKLNHTIVFTRDKRASSKFLTEILGLPDAVPFGPFLAVQVGEVTLDYDEVDEPSSGHYAFLVS